MMKYYNDRALYSAYKYSKVLYKVWHNYIYDNKRKSDQEEREKAYGLHVSDLTTAWEILLVKVA